MGTIGEVKAFFDEIETPTGSLWKDYKAYRDQRIPKDKNKQDEKRKSVISWTSAP